MDNLNPEEGKKMWVLLEKKRITEQIQVIYSIIKCHFPLSSPLNQLRQKLQIGFSQKGHTHLLFFGICVVPITMKTSY